LTVDNSDLVTDFDHYQQILTIANINFSGSGVGLVGSLELVMECQKPVALKLLEWRLAAYPVP